MDKTTVVLPGQLAGAQNLLLLSWARDQAGQIESWTAVSQALEDMHPSARVYTALVSPPENILFRWWDNASLRASQTDPELLHWTLALYTDKTVLRRSLEIADEHEVVALLVDRAGHVLWKAQGSSTPASRAALLAVANHVGS